MTPELEERSDFARWKSGEKKAVQRGELGNTGNGQNANSQATARADSCAAEGPDLRPDRARNGADAHPPPRQAVSILRVHRRAEAGEVSLSGWTCAGRGDRARGDHAGSSTAHHARDRCAHVASGARA